MAVLVIGATGILRPAVSALVAAGEKVVALARSPGRLTDLSREDSSIEPISVDASDARALARVIEKRTFEAAIVYTPAIGPDSLRLLRPAVTGRLVLVLTSAAADTAADTAADEFSVADLGSPAFGEKRLVLGWARSGSSARWHTPTEVSDAALEVLSDGRERILGTVRPWADRPR